MQRRLAGRPAVLSIVTKAKMTLYAFKSATWLLLLLWSSHVGATPLRGSYRQSPLRKRHLVMDHMNTTTIKAPPKAPGQSPTTTPPPTPGGLTSSGLTSGGIVAVVLVGALVVSLVAVFVYKKMPRRVDGVSQQNSAKASRQNEASARLSHASETASQANGALARPSPWGFDNNLRRVDSDVQSDRQSGAESMLGMESNMSSYAHTLDDGIIQTGWGAESMLGMESNMSCAYSLEDGISETMTADFSDTHTPVPSVIARMSSMGSESNDENDDLDIDKEFSPTASSILREITAPPGTLGLVLNTSDKRPVVQHVAAGSPLEGTVWPGDVIVSIDGIKTKQMSAEDMTQHLTENRFKERKMTVLSDGRA